MEETIYPKMRRPRRKLCYLTRKDNPPKQLATVFTLEDVDKMFDDLDSSPHEDVQSPSPLLQTFEYGPQLNETEVSPIPKEGQLMVNEVDRPYPAIRSSSPKPDVDMHVASAQQSVGLKHSVIRHNKIAHAVSPVVFLMEDEIQEKAPYAPPATQSNQGDEQVTEEIATSEPVQSLPSNATFTKTASQKKTPAVSRRKEKAEKKKDPEKNSKSVPRPPPAETFTRPRNDMTAFLQKLKLKESGQSKAPCSRQPVLPVQIPAPPEPEDDFLILEDDVTFQFSIPSKHSPGKRQKQSRNSSSDKDNSTEQGSAKENSSQTPQNQEESEEFNDKPANQTVDQKTKKKNGRVKKKKVTGPERDEERLPIEEDQPIRKKQEWKTGQSKERDGGENQPKESSKKAKIPAQKLDIKTRTPAKSKKSSKEKREKTSKTWTKSSKGDRKGPQGTDAVKETEEAEAVEQQSEPHSPEPVETEDPPSPEKEIVNSDTSGKTKQNKPSSKSDGSSSENSQILGKRKRNPPGLWWQSSPQNGQETADQQPTVKKSRHPLNKTEAAASSPARKDKKDKVLKKRKQKETPVLSCRHPKNVKKNPKQNKKGRMREDSPVEKIATDEVSEAVEEQQEVPEADRGHSSPLIFTRKDHSSISASEPPGQRKEQQGAAQAAQRRNAVGSWSMVNNNMAEDVESSSPQQLQPRTSKPRKERKKPSSSNPVGGAPVPPLKIKPLFPQQTAKRSLAKFTDIFTSDIASRVVSNRDTQQRKRRNVPSRHAEDCGRSWQSHTDADEHTLHNPDTPPDDRSEILRSGPSSLVRLDNYNDEGSPSPKLQSTLCVSDLCGFPLRPLVLQKKDRDNLALWFKSLWSTVAKNDVEITPDQFDWYFYQDGAMGLQAELNSGSICTGKILLGSHMKKPLWVDHSAATVFHLLTSSVIVTIDASESRVGPGESFMVNCGHAYSIKNITAQPAVLHFTRIRAESLDLKSSP